MNDKTAAKKYDQAPQAQPAEATPALPSAAAAPAAPEVPRPLRIVTPDRWSTKEHRDPGYTLDVPAGTTIEEILEPRFLAPFIKSARAPMRRRCTVHVHWDDASQVATLYIVDIQMNRVSLALLDHRNIEPVRLGVAESDYAIEYRGAIKQHVVLYRGTEINTGLATEADALRWRAEHMRK